MSEQVQSNSTKEDNKVAIANADGAKAKSEPKKETSAPKKAVSATYFKNTEYAGESIYLGEDDPNDATTVRLVTFRKYAFRVRGADVLEGYLETTDPKVVKVLSNTPHVEEISSKEYEKALKDGREVV